MLLSVVNKQCGNCWSDLQQTVPSCSKGHVGHGNSFPSNTRTRIDINRYHICVVPASFHCCKGFSCLTCHFVLINFMRCLLLPRNDQMIPLDSRYLHPKIYLCSCKSYFSNLTIPMLFRALSCPDTAMQATRGRGSIHPTHSWPRH
jgi:hypothetical protein